ncbi:MAG: hypothetical protein RLZZ232_127 [Planctomycetota bacterium]|jgi:hypothetical protein
MTDSLSSLTASATSGVRGSAAALSKQFHRGVAKWFRWLHIYLSLLSFGAILFFSVTGLTLNHPDWFFRESTTTVEGTLDVAWLNGTQPAPQNWDETDYGHQIDKLSVAETLRARHHLAGKVSEFLAFQDECEVTFQGPGYAATARVTRQDGRYSVTIISNDFISVMNDLHKGRHTGSIWSVVIDVSAIASGLVAISGLVLVFYLKLNRGRRLVLTGLGVVLLVWLIRVAVR